jgi:hypothetical protein
MDYRHLSNITMFFYKNTDFDLHNDITHIQA